MKNQLFLIALLISSFLWADDKGKLWIEKEFCQLAYDGNLIALKDFVKQYHPSPFSRDQGMGGTALHASIFQKDISVVRYLIDYGCDVNAQGLQNKYTPLHDAVWANNSEAIILLLKSGANKNIRNDVNQTPYEKAIQENKKNLAELLK